MSGLVKRLKENMKLPKLEGNNSQKIDHLYKRSVKLEFFVLLEAMAIVGLIGTLALVSNNLNTVERDNAQLKRAIKQMQDTQSKMQQSVAKYQR